MCGQNNNTWAKQTTEWIPHGYKRKRGKSHTKWRDELFEFNYN